MKANFEKELTFPVYVSGKRACVAGRSVAGVKFTPEMIDLIETKKPKPDWVYVQFWVAKQSLLKALLNGKKPGRLFLMAKFYTKDEKTKSMYVRNVWLKGEALDFIKNYWEKEIPK